MAALGPALLAHGEDFAVQAHPFVAICLCLSVCLSAACLSVRLYACLSVCLKCLSVLPGTVVVISPMCGMDVSWSELLLLLRL